jgi:hypothetical protein
MVEEIRRAIARASHKQEESRVEAFRRKAEVTKIAGRDRKGERFRHQGFGEKT